MLLAGFANLLAVTVLAPPLGLWLRRRRPDLPRLVAANYAGAALLAAISVLLVAGGLLHRSAVRAEERARAGRRRRDARLRRRAGAASTAARSAPIDAIRLDDDYYRACVPGDDARHWLCLFVSTDQHPPGVTRDTEEVPNSSYRPYGGFD